MTTTFSTIKFDFNGPGNSGTAGYSGVQYNTDWNASVGYGYIYRAGVAGFERAGGPSLYGDGHWGLATTLGQFAVGVKPNTVYLVNIIYGDYTTAIGDIAGHIENLPGYFVFTGLDALATTYKTISYFAQDADANGYITISTSGTNASSPDWKILAAEVYELTTAVDWNVCPTPSAVRKFDCEKAGSPSLDSDYIAIYMNTMWSDAQGYGYIVPPYSEINRAACSSNKNKDFHSNWDATRAHRHAGAVFAFSALSGVTYRVDLTFGDYSAERNKQIAYIENNPYTNTESVDTAANVFTTVSALGKDSDGDGRIHILIKDIFNPSNSSEDPDWALTAIEIYQLTFLVPPGSLSLTGYIPSVLTVRTCSPNAGALSLSGYAPTICFSINSNISINYDNTIQVSDNKQIVTESNIFVDNSNILVMSNYIGYESFGTMDVSYLNQLSNDYTLVSEPLLSVSQQYSKPFEILNYISREGQHALDYIGTVFGVSGELVADFLIDVLGSGEISFGSLLESCEYNLIPFESLLDININKAYILDYTNFISSIYNEFVISYLIDILGSYNFLLESLLELYNSGEYPIEHILSIQSLGENVYEILCGVKTYFVPNYDSNIIVQNIVSEPIESLIDVNIDNEIPVEHRFLILVEVIGTDEISIEHLSSVFSINSIPSIWNENVAILTNMAISFGITLQSDCAMSVDWFKELSAVYNTLSLSFLTSVFNDVDVNVDNIQILDFGTIFSISFIANKIPLNNLEYIHGVNRYRRNVEYVYCPTFAEYYYRVNKSGEHESKLIFNKEGDYEYTVN
jgi:hypothetical protein